MDTKLNNLTKKHIFMQTEVQAEYKAIAKKLRHYQIPFKWDKKIAQFTFGRVQSRKLIRAPKRSYFRAIATALPLILAITIWIMYTTHFLIANKQLVHITIVLLLFYSILVMLLKSKEVKKSRFGVTFSPDLIMVRKDSDNLQFHPIEIKSVKTDISFINHRYKGVISIETQKGMAFTLATLTEKNKLYLAHDLEYLKKLIEKIISQKMKRTFCTS